MEFNNFLETLKSAKQCMLYSSNGEYRVVVNPEHTIWTITKKSPEKICKHCGTDLTKVNPQEMVMKFAHVREHLTVFETSALWLLFMEKKRVIDWGNFHTCPYGKKFIEDLIEVKIQ